MKKTVALLLFIVLSMLFAFSQDTAKPVQGEGIHAFLKRNNRPGKEYEQKFIELNKDKLGTNQSLKLGVSYKLPPLAKTGSEIKANPAQQKTSKTGTEPLFGKDLAKYEIISDRLKGACFFLVSGHGGPDPGAITKIGNVTLHEDEYAYDIMLRLARNLLQEGATVHIIIQDAKDGIRDDKYLSNSNRETCMGKEIPLNNVERLNQRCDKINSLSKKSNAKYQRAVFIHLDSRPKKQPVDIFFYHWEDSPKGKELANTLRKTIHENYNKNQPNRGFDGTVKSRNLHVLRKSNPASVLVELGNLRNEGRDRQRFLESNNRQAVANWLYKGLIKDYEDNK